MNNKSFNKDELRNIYLVKLKEFRTEQINSWIVIAKNSLEAIELCGLNVDTAKEAEELGIFEDNLYRENIESIKLIGISFLNSQVMLNSVYTQ